MGMTLFLNKHFTLKTWNGSNFYGFDNCAYLNGVLNNSRNNMDFGHAFYKFDDF